VKEAIKRRNGSRRQRKTFGEEVAQVASGKQKGGIPETTRFMRKRKNKRTKF
jgi:hypothetical protein